MPRDLTLSVSISARLAGAFRSTVNAARAGLRGVRSDAQRQAAAARAGDRKSVV